MERIIALSDLSGDCWVFTGATDAKGYGRINKGRRGEGVVGVHHAVFEFVHGPLGPGEFALHRCDNPPCWRPDHLFKGTNADNIRDAHAKGRSWQRGRTHCPAGHPYDEANTYIDGRGARQCRACRRQRRRAAKERTGVWK